MDDPDAINNEIPRVGEDDDDETGSSNIDVNYPESQRMDAEASNSLNSSGNNSSGTLCPQLSPRSTSPTGSSTELLKLDMTNIPKEQRSSQDSEKHIVELITQSSWLQAVKAFKFLILYAFVINISL